MRAVARLVWTFFCATPLMRWFACVGVGAILLGIAGYLMVPAWTLGTGMRREALWLQALVEILPAIGLLALLAASTPLPAVVERLALGRGVWLLPAGRARLLAATFVPALLIGVLTATTAALHYWNYPIEISYGRIFWRTWVMAFIDVGLIYAAVWLCGKTSGVWRLVGVFWILLSLTVPLRYIAGIPPFSGLEVAGLALWALFALSLLAGGRLRHALAPWRGRLAAVRTRLFHASPYRAGGELDLLLGTSRPWIVAFGQAIPIAAMLLLIPAESPLIGVSFVFVILMSTVAGAITSKAAERSRRLWLRLDWTRDELLRHVELAFWRYNAWCIGMLALAFIAVCSWLDFPPKVVAMGVGLLVAGGIALACLGLAITRGLGWLESVFCIVTTVILVRATRATLIADFSTAIALAVLLVVLAVFFRWLARRRWHRLDWMLCRPT